jgi:UPF0716 family protein affecting phage T7 exclusion
MDGGDEGGTDVSDLGLLFGILFNLAIVFAIGGVIGVAGHYVLAKVFSCTAGALSGTAAGQQTAHYCAADTHDGQQARQDHRVA